MSRSSKFRSGLEKAFSACVKGEGFDFEPFMVPYVVHRDYKPDFVHSHTGLMVECKGFFRAGDTQKYKAIRDSLDRNTELVFLLSDPNKKLRKGAQMTMGEWCLKEGFKVYTLDTVENLLEYINSEKVSKYHSKRKSK